MTGTTDNTGVVAADLAWPHNPAIGNDPFSWPDPLQATAHPYAVSGVQMPRQGFLPTCEDIGLRRPLIGFDFRKRQYNGV